MEKHKSISFGVETMLPYYEFVVEIVFSNRSEEDWIRVEWK